MICRYACDFGIIDNLSFYYYFLSRLYEVQGELL